MSENKRNMDSAFRQILSNKTILYEFIQMFLSKLAEETSIKESDIKIHNTDFLSSDLESKRPDILFSLTIKEKELYIYVLIEHQSYKDPNMPYRIFDYMSRTWGYIISHDERKAKSKSYKYPQIIPVVFYTGKGNWTIQTDIKNKINPAPGYEEYLPSLKYITIELSKLSKRKLLRTKTVLSKLLYYIKAEKLDEIVTLFDKSMNDLLGEKYKLFKKSLKTLLIGSGLSANEADGIVEELLSGEEVKSMIRLLEKARKEGKKEGILAGILEAKKQDIFEILTERFGEVPKDIKEAIEKSKDLETLTELVRKSAVVKNIDEFRNLLKRGEKA